VTDQPWNGTDAASHEHARRGRLYGAAASGVLFAGALGYIGLVDPHDTKSVYPQCPFKMITGWNCPFCGGLRMTHDLLHGHLAASINDNIFLLVGIPLLIGWIVLRRRVGRSLLPVSAWVTIVVASFAWTVLRNLPGFPLVPTILSG
jgi:Protein of unknown function (DUF2752)